MRELSDNDLKHLILDYLKYYGPTNLSALTERMISHQSVSRANVGKLLEQLEREGKVTRESRQGKITLWKLS